MKPVSIIIFTVLLGALSCFQYQGYGQGRNYAEVNKKINSLIKNTKKFNTVQEEANKHAIIKYCKLQKQLSKKLCVYFPEFTDVYNSVTNDPLLHYKALKNLPYKFPEHNSNLIDTTISLLKYFECDSLYKDQVSPNNNLKNIELASRPDLDSHTLEEYFNIKIKQLNVIPKPTLTRLDEFKDFQLFIRKFASKNMLQMSRYKNKNHTNLTFIKSKVRDKRLWKSCLTDELVNRNLEIPPFKEGHLNNYIQDNNFIQTELANDLQKINPPTFKVSEINKINPLDKVPNITTEFLNFDFLKLNLDTLKSLKPGSSGKDESRWCILTENNYHINNRLYTIGISAAYKYLESKKLNSYLYGGISGGSAIMPISSSVLNGRYVGSHIGLFFSQHIYKNFIINGDAKFSNYLLTDERFKNYLVLKPEDVSSFQLISKWNFHFSTTIGYQLSKKGYNCIEMGYDYIYNTWLIKITNSNPLKIKSRKLTIPYNLNL